MAKRTGLCALLLIVMSALLVGCRSDNDADSKERSVVNDQQEIYGRNQPSPTFNYSLTRDLLLQIYRAKTTSAVSTWSVISSQGTGQILFVCPSIGYPLPADQQLTNPWQPQKYKDGVIVIGQPEPDGTFTSQNTDATYVLCVTETGDYAPVYTEQKVTAYPFAIEVRNGIVEPVDGDSSIDIDLSGVGR